MDPGTLALQMFSTTFENLLYPAILVVAIVNLCSQVKSEQLIGFHVCGLFNAFSLQLGPAVVYFVSAISYNGYSTSPPQNYMLIPSAIMFLIGIILLCASSIGVMVVAGRMYRAHKHALRCGLYNNHHHTQTQKLEPPYVYSSVNNAAYPQYQPVPQSPYTTAPSPVQYPNEFVK